jgi:tripartite-type tricarboxylate transporter receptor subunit TctC
MKFTKPIQAALMALGLCLTGAAHAQAAADYPNRPIRFVIPFGAGTTTDQAGRFVAQKITDMTKQPVVVDNKPGGNGVIGVMQAAQALPDGYTVLIGTNTTQAANVSLMKKLPYEPLKDFVPVTGLIEGGVVLTVRPNLPVKNVQELIALAKKNPGKMTFGSGNSSSRAGGEVMKELAGIDILHVPFKTLPDAITNLIGGQIDMVFGDAPGVMPLVRAGKLKALGVSTPTRMPGAEDIPTMVEEGVKGYQVTGWLAVFVPAKTPPEVVTKLNTMINAIMRTQEAKDYFGKNAWTPIPMTQEDTVKFNKKEIDGWARLVKAANIEPE